MIKALAAALAAEDPNAVQSAIFELGQLRTVEDTIPDEIALQVLEMLRRPELGGSSLSGHVLNFFEFESPRLSQLAKDRCAAFLREWGSQFTHVHSVQVVGELLYGDYLRPVLPTPTRKKPRWK